MCRLSVIVFLAIILLYSCVDKSYYEKNISIAGQAWVYENKPEFSIHVDDAAAKFDVYINVRHSSSYDFANLFVLLHEKGKGLKDTAYRKEIPLAQRDGRWLGSSAAGLYEQVYLAKKDFSFPDTGLYTLSLEQNMRQNPLNSIADVGIKLIKK